jgi:methionine biosynthesis protein MetW
MIDQATRDYAKEGDRYYDEYWSGATGWKPPAGLDDDLRQWLDPLLVRGHTVLDVGCGDGARYGARLHDSGVTVHGVDISSVAVAEARKRGIDARVSCLDSGLPYPDASFDAVICLEVLEHLVNPETVAREIRRVLKPGGRALISVPNTGFYTTRLELLLTGHFNPRGSPVTQRAYPWRDPHVRFLTFRSVRAMLVEAGLVVQRAGGLECQFMRVAGVGRLFGRTHTFVDAPFEAVGRAWPSLLARRCVVLAGAPERKE